jgi:hypothetical protein
MTVSELVERLEASQYRTDVIARMIGYVVLIKRSGWEGLRLSRAAKFALIKNFRSLGIDPEAVVFEPS